MRSQRIHLVGIGGCGMCGLARVMAVRGHRVTGSDRAGNDSTRRLEEELGVRIQEGQEPYPVTMEVDRLIHTAAVGADHPEVARALELGIEVETYAQALGREFRESDCAIAVSGTHGKTTTSSLVSYLLQSAGVDPSYVIGGDVPQLHGNAAAGKGPHFVAEACEFGRSFHHLNSRIAIVTNIEADHLDYYQDLDEIAASFATFASKVDPGGTVLCHYSASELLQSRGPYGAQWMTYGSHPDADWSVTDIHFDGKKTQFALTVMGEDRGRFELSLSGNHNVENAVAALGACNRAGVDLELLKALLPGFTGVRRRFEMILDAPDLTVVNDYAHHPTEVKAVLATARTVFEGRRIWCVFQPHQYSRTRMLLDDFGDSFSDADRVIIPDIYAARDTEEERRSVHSRDLVASILAAGGEAFYIPAFEEVLAWFEESLQPKDVVLTLGAGNVDGLSRELVRRHGGVARLENMERARSKSGRFEVVAG
ncbi:MAG: UDP-N-acetylmuramate--L-alanine ligase [Planctomycetota bacterium]|nr:UDP-N-acetylmuramate--L-alanine ligase [Planctomycetota bacterium]